MEQQATILETTMTKNYNRVFNKDVVPIIHKRLLKRYPHLTKAEVAYVINKHLWFLVIVFRLKRSVLIKYKGHKLIHFKNVNFKKHESKH
jgi:hypothetical protein